MVSFLLAPSLASQLLQFLVFTDLVFETEPCRSWLASEEAGTGTDKFACLTPDKSRPTHSLVLTRDRWQTALPFYAVRF